MGTGVGGHLRRLFDLGLRRADRQQQNVGGLGLQCKYLTARNVAIAQYVNGDNGFIGVADCPLFKKIETVVD